LNLNGMKGSNVRMADKTSGRRQTAAKKSRSPKTLPPSAEVVKADRYIADQLKAMYDAVVLEPLPDRLMNLLDRLDDEKE
jgi:Anti-sigma factor NepR